MRTSAMLRYVFLISLCFSEYAWGGRKAPLRPKIPSGAALIVHDGTAGTEADVMANMSGKLTTAGYTVSTSVGVPGGSLAANHQIWDIRFNNTTPLSAGDITAYVTYLAGGGSLFVMGENVGFLTRDNSIASLIQTAGGGTISIVTPSNAETVQSPFTGPTSVASITFLAAAGTAAAGSLSFIAKDANNIGAGILYGPGALSNAHAGSLLIVFDVNFLQASADANSQALSNNMIAYLAAPVPVPPAAGGSTHPPPVPTPTLSEWGTILLGCSLLLVASHRLLTKEQARTNR